MLRWEKEKRKFSIEENVDVINAINDNIIPHIIAHEYRRFYQMVKDRQYSGAWFELKDVVEVVVKLPIFIGISYLFQQDNLEKLGNNILKNMLRKPQALGDWIGYGERLKNDKGIKNDIPTISKLLKSIYEFNKECNVVEWRNDMIGHGALPFEDSDDFVEKMCELSEGIDECLKASISLYRTMKFDFTDEEMLVECDQKKWGLDKCIFEKAFFFDRYNRGINKITSLKYENGERKEFNNIWYSGMIESLRMGELAGIKNEKDRSWQDIMNLQKLNRTVRYQQNDTIMEWLISCVDKNEKGVFLLLMDRGMGKTAFVSSINQLLDDKKENEWYTRVYYCNTLKYRSIDDFVTEFGSLLRMERSATETLIETDVPTLTKEDSSEKVAECLKIKLDKIRAREDDEQIKLLFVFDGIDEIYVEGYKKNIYDFIPQSSQLSEGVYILLTSRNGESGPLGDYTRNKLEELKKNSITETLEFTLKNEKHRAAYIQMLKEYFLNNCVENDKGKNGKNSRKNQLSDEEQNAFKEMCERSNEKFVEFRIFTSIYNELKRRNLDISEIFTKGRGLEIYFRFMEEQLGEKLYKMAGKILLIVATAEKSLTIDDCIFLERLQKGGNVVEVLAVLKMFEGLFVYEREKSDNIDNNTVIRIVNEEYKNAIFTEFKDLLDEIVEKWIYFIETRYERMCALGQEYDPLKDYDTSEIYLYAVIYNYVMEQSGKSKHIERIHCREFADAIFQYEKGMPTKQLGLNAKAMDIAMSEACLKILERIDIRDGKLYSGAFNNYMFHIKDEYFQTWGKENKDKRALWEKEEIERRYDAEIKKLEQMQNKSIDILDILEKLYASKGIFILKQNERFEEIEGLFEKSCKIVEEILNQDMKAGCCIYIQAVERLISQLHRQKKIEKIEEMYDKALEKICIIKDSEEAKPYMYVNARRRIEYGVRTREAMLYRKLASICDDMNWTPKDESVEGFYERSKAILAEIQKQNLTEGQARIIADYMRIVNSEYGHYAKKIGNYRRAVELYNDAIELVEKLIKANNIMVDESIVEIYRCCVQLMWQEDMLSEEERGQRNQRIKELEKIRIG